MHFPGPNLIVMHYPGPNLTVMHYPGPNLTVMHFPGPNLTVFDRAPTPLKVQPSGVYLSLPRTAVPHHLAHHLATNQVQGSAKDNQSGRLGRTEATNHVTGSLKTISHLKG
jgi:hypothetical protein